MIDEARTQELFGYTSDSLTHGSHKKVCVVCDECGEVRILKYQDYRALCQQCVRWGKKNSFYGKKHSDESRKKMSEAQSGEKHHYHGKHLPEEHRQKIGDANRNPSTETRRKMGTGKRGKKRSDETRRKIGEAVKGKLAGAKNPNWQGGVSFEPYCHKFNESFKESIREKFGRTCFLCPTTEAENGQKLSVHHVNYDKNCLCDNIKCEFVPLCTSCHIKTNYNRKHWENRIIEKLKNDSQLLNHPVTNKH